MPIINKEIHSFLKEHKDEAFSKSELREDFFLGGIKPTPSTEIAAFEEALSVLVRIRRNKVQKNCWEIIKRNCRRVYNLL